MAGQRLWMYRPFRRALPWLVAALLVTGIGLPVVAASSGHLPRGTEIGYGVPTTPKLEHENVTVIMTDAPAYIPSAITVNTSTILTVHVENAGNLTHTFTVSNVSGANALPSNSTPQQVDQFFRTHGDQANLSLAPGAQGFVNLTFGVGSALDVYQFVSVIPYQFQAGMAGTISVAGGPPSVLLEDNTSDALQFLPNTLVVNVTHYPVVVGVLVSNLGSFSHTFTVSPFANYSLSPANFTSFFQAHPPLINAPVPSGAGSTVWANFTLGHPGVYQYICTVPGHFASGMYGFVYANVVPPPPPAPPSTAIVQGWVLLGAGLLLVVALLVGVSAAYVGRLPPKSEEPAEH
jgi:uncharacterized cupredoxin-like copper-binding protein